MFVLQNEEKSQSEVSVNTPTALPSSFHFQLIVAGLVGTSACFHTCIQLHVQPYCFCLCNRLFLHSEHLRTPVCALLSSCGFISSFNRNTSELRSRSLPGLLLQSFPLRCDTHCLYPFVFLLFCMFYFFNLADTKAATGAGCLPGKGLCPHDTTEC